MGEREGRIRRGRRAENRMVATVRGLLPLTSFNCICCNFVQIQAVLALTFHDHARVDFGLLTRSWRDNYRGSEFFYVERVEADACIAAERAAEEGRESGRCWMTSQVIQKEVPT